MSTGQGTTGVDPSTRNSTTADSPSHEFVSDSVRASDTDIQEVREGMKKLGMQSTKGQYSLPVSGKKKIFKTSDPINDDDFAIGIVRLEL